MISWLTSGEARVATCKIPAPRIPYADPGRCLLLNRGVSKTIQVAAALGLAFAALDASVKDLERQLSRHKEKFRNRKHPEDMPNKAGL